MNIGKKSRMARKLRSERRKMFGAACRVKGCGAAVARFEATFKSNQRRAEMAEQKME